MSDLLQVKNDEGNVVYMAGALPDGTFGIVADEVRPFTPDELADPYKFAVHSEDLARRFDEGISDMT